MASLSGQKPQAPVRPASKLSFEPTGAIEVVLSPQDVAGLQQRFYALDMDEDGEGE